MFRWILAAMLIAGMAQPASAQRAGQEPLASSLSTPAFVRKSTAGNLFEIRSSQLALTRSRDARVRSFARRIAADHRKAGEQMQAAVRRAGLKQPAQRMDSQHLNILAQLRNAPRHDFDRAYIDAQTEAHQSAIALHQAYARSGRRAELRQFARHVLPILREHYDMALRLGPRVAAR